MATGKRASKAPDRFKVGQQVVLCFCKASGWERASGELGVIVGPKVDGVWHCTDMAHTRRGSQTGPRYAVRWKGGVMNIDEEQLRPIYDGEKLSSWEKFSKKTGVDVRVAPRPKAKSVAMLVGAGSAAADGCGFATIVQAPFGYGFTRASVDAFLRDWHALPVNHRVSVAKALSLMGAPYLDAST